MNPDLTHSRPRQHVKEPAPVVVQVFASVFGVFLAQELGQTLLAKAIIGTLGALITAFLTAPGRRKERRIVAVAVFLGLLDGAKEAFAATRRRLLGTGTSSDTRQSRPPAAQRLPTSVRHASQWLPSAPGWTVGAAVVGLAIGTAGTALASGLQPQRGPAFRPAPPAASPSGNPTTPAVPQTGVSGGPNAGTSVEVERSGTVKLRVSLAAGQPAAGWEVDVYRGAGAAADQNYVGYGYADQTGSIAFELKAGTYRLVAHGGTNGHSEQIVTLTAGQPVAALINAAIGTVKLRVSLAAGQPAAGWEVDVYRGAGAAADQNYVGYGYADQTGSIAFELKAGTYRLVAHGGTNGHSEQIVTLTAGQPVAALINAAIGTVKLRVSLAAGQPAAGWEVDVYRGAGAAADQNYVGYGYADQTGSIAFELKAGTYRLVAHGGTNGHSEQIVTLTAGQPVAALITSP